MQKDLWYNIRVAKQKKSKGRVVDFNKALEEKERKKQAEKAKRSENEPVEISDRSEASVKRKKKQHHRRLGLYALVIIILLVAAGLLAHNIIELKVEESKLQSQINQLEKKKEELKEEKKAVTDPDYVEQQARKQLKMIKPGEILYILPNQEETKTEEGGND